MLYRRTHCRCRPESECDVDIYTIIFLALAVFIFLRLRNVLGQRTGSEQPPYDRAARDIVHGAQDWMFPPGMAQGAQRALQQAGAKVTYREIADLSHTYPRDENAAILDWFLAAEFLRA